MKTVTFKTKTRPMDYSQLTTVSCCIFPPYMNNIDRKITDKSLIILNNYLVISHYNSNGDHLYFSPTIPCKNQSTDFRSKSSNGVFKLQTTLSGKL